jgi:hypothetical protein
MAQSDASLDNPSTDELLARVRGFLNELPPVVIRRSVSAAIGRLIVGAFVLGLGTLALYHFNKSTVELVVGSGFALYGVWNLLLGLVGVVDRSPQLVLDSEGLTDYQGGAGRILWTNIRRASLHRSTRNGSEMSASLTLTLFEPIHGKDQIEITLTDLDCSSTGLLEVIGRRANLE